MFKKFEIYEIILKSSLFAQILNLGAYKRKLGAHISETLFKCLLMRALKKIPFLWSSAGKTANIFVGLKFLS